MGCLLANESLVTLRDHVGLNLLGGVEWAGIELVAETLGYTDLEFLIHQLVVIRERQRDD